MKNPNWTQPDWQKIESAIERSDHKYRPEFVAWLKDNFEVWSEFVKQTKVAFQFQHRARLSARLIVENMRYNSVIREKGCIFKISNNYIPDMARLIMELHEPLNGFFETRNNPVRNNEMCKTI